MKKLIAIFVLILLSDQAPGQAAEIFLLNSKFTDLSGTKNLEATFIVWTQNKADFPPTIATPTFCTLFGNGKEKTIELTNSNLSISSYSRRAANKNREMQALINNFPASKSKKHYFIVTYSIKSLERGFSTLRFYAAFKAKRDPAMCTMTAPPIEFK